MEWIFAVAVLLLCFGVGYVTLSYGGLVVPAGLVALGMWQFGWPTPGESTDEAGALPFLFVGGFCVVALVWAAGVHTGRSGARRHAAARERELDRWRSQP